METLKHSNTYFIANIFTTGFSFLTLPIFTYLMSNAEIGIYSVFMAFTGFVMVFLGFNFYSAVSRYYYEDKSDFGSFLGTSVLLTFITSCFSIFIYFIFSGFFNNVISLPSPLAIYLIALSIFLILESIYTQLLIAMKKSKKYFIIIVSKFFIILSLSIIGVYILPTDKYLGRIIPILLINFLYAIFYFANIVKISNLHLTAEHVKYLVYYSIPLIPYTISGVILNFFDRIFINYVKGPADSGLYSIGYAIASITALALTAIHSAQTPEFFRLMREKDYGKYFLLIKRLFSLFVLFGFIIILFSKEILFLLTDPKFHSSYIVIPPVVLGYLFNGLFYIYGQYIGYEKKTVYLSIIVVLAGLINIFFNFLLIPKLGIIAGAYTTFISYLCLFIFAWIVSKFILKQVVVPLWLVLKPMILILILTSIYFLGLSIISEFIIVLFYKITLIFFFCLIVFYSDLKKVMISN